MRCKISVPILLFFFLLAVPVFAKSEFVQLPDEGMNIIYPQNDFFLAGQNFTLEFHVYNSTNFILGNDTTDCYIHIYNNTGDHIFYGELAFSTNESNFYYDFNITEYLTQQGSYPYLAHCNNSYEAGYVSDTFIIGSRNYTPVENRILPTIIAICLTIFLMFYISFKINKEHFIMQIMFITTGITLFMTIPLAISMPVSVNETFYKIMLWFVRVFWLYCSVFIIHKVLLWKGYLNPK